MININITQVRFESSGGEQLVRFEGNGIDWASVEVNVNNFWCMAEARQETAKQGNILITADKNTNEDRSCTITLTVTDEDGRNDYLIQVNQEGEANLPYFLIGKDNFTLSSAAQYFYTDYSIYRIDNIISSINVDWISEQEPFRYSATRNTESSTRTGKITLTAYADNGTTIVQEITVMQASQNEEIILSETDVEVDYRAQDYPVYATTRGITEMTVEGNTASEWCDVQFVYPVPMTDWESSEETGEGEEQDPNKIQIHIKEDSTIEINLNFAYNPTNFDREGVITIKGGNQIMDINVKQTANVEYLEFPIWKDTKITLPEQSLYRILDGNDIIYQGRIYGTEVYINRVLRSYVENTIQLSNDISFGGVLQNNNSYKTFNVQILKNDSFVDYYIIRTYYDYSYKNNDNHLLSRPIFNYVDVRQIFLMTAFNSYKDAEQTLMIQNTNGQPHSPGFTRYFEIDKGIYTYLGYRLIENEIIVDFTGNEKRFKVVNTCAKYAAYYLNQYGGWDSLLFIGKSTKDGATNEVSQYKADFDNTTINFSTTDYQKVSSIRHKCNTNYMTDSQSKLVPQLLNSTQIYLHDLEENRIFPVIIKNTDYDIKQYFNNNRKLVNYQFEFEESQEHIIR